MKALSLFSGIGGIDLAAEWAGIETVAFCEREPFCQKVLAKHWPNIPIYDDVCTLTKERLETDGIGTIDIISAGYPCQPFSVAGKREGEEDDRYLWDEIARLLQTIRPRWFIGENVAGHISLGLDRVLSELDSLLYTSQAFVIPAAAVNARHRRDRVFIVAHTSEERLQGIPEEQILGIENIQIELPRSNQGFDRGWDHAKPRVYRTGNGIPNIMDRIAALGNAVVPQQIYPILAAIKQIDDMMRAS